MAETVVSESVVCPGGMPGFLAHPAAAGHYPVVVLMHERYGLVRHTQDLARRCASDGFTVLAPNFFYRHPDQAALNAGDSRYDLTDPESVELLRAALAALDTNPFADMSRIAVAGYCQTGRHPLVFAAEAPIQAAIVWYGAAAKREWQMTETQPKPLNDIIAQIDCPVFGAFGSDDHIISVDDVRRFRNALEEHKKSYDMHLYAGAPHGWLNDTMPGRYRKLQADAAWTAQQRFLKAVFAGAWPKDSVRWQFDSTFRRDYDFAKNRRQE
ncbi:MAG TPA: dienelactone hydrolase family protein [Micropepsaceae bacterium]|jgi:carboxymethylenebutenolidase|nr:dienelactone hydrolase family protein [Micropepsaceae bacterium]